MPGLSEQIWRAFVLSELPFYSVSLPLPEKVVSPLPSSTHHCLSCNNYELIIDGDDGWRQWRGVSVPMRRRTRIGLCVSVWRVSLIYNLILYILFIYFIYSLFLYTFYIPYFYILFIFLISIYLILDILVLIYLIKLYECSYIPYNII